MTRTVWLSHLEQVENGRVFSKLCPLLCWETAWWQSERNKLILIECPPDTEIFSKRRKIYSICVEGMSWCLVDNLQSVPWLARSKTLLGLGPHHVVGGYQKLMNYGFDPHFCKTMSSYRFSAFWLRSKCSICSYQLNIWYEGHVPSSILNWFL